jgi:predicted nucleic acid-binding protein
MNGIRLTTSRVYLDANAVIHFIESAETPTAFVFDRARTGMVRIFTSERTLAEGLTPLRDDDQALVTAYEDFLKGDDLMAVVPIDRTISNASGNFRAVSGSRTPDSIHVATAMATQCALFISSDKRLKMSNRIERDAVEVADNLDLWT